MDYKKVGLEILDLVGGADNVAKLTHCATRLRFEFVDRKKVKENDIKNLSGVISVVDKGGQFQIVIGNDVQTAFKAITQKLGNNSVKSSGKDKKEGIVSYIISVISTTFTPMIPAITGAGMIKAVLAILTLVGAISESSHTYYILNTIADSAFYFMPILLAYGASIKFECSTALAITLGGVLLHPNLGALLSTGESVHFMGIGVRLTDYAGSVLPIIITVWVMSYVERFAEKVSPSVIKFFTKPLIVLIITAPIALIVIGPFGTFLNDMVALGAEKINGYASWLIPFLMGALQPFLVVTGTAWAMTPIATMQLTSMGAERINGPGMLASNIAQGGATLCVALKTKNKELKQLAGSSGLTAVLGITEPSLYGVTLKLKRPLIASMIGGGIAGIYAGLTDLVRYAFVSPGLAALPAFIGENPMNIIHAIVTCIIAFVSAFIVTWIIGFEDPVDESIEKIENKSFAKSDDKVYDIVNPIEGKIIPLSNVNDAVFSQELLGKGIAIEPSSGEVFAPTDGTITSIFDTKHAISLLSDNGMEILIHIGIDTVNMNGKGYEVFVKVGQKVKAGEKIAEFDIDEIKRNGYETTTPILICNHNEYNNIEVFDNKTAKVGEVIIRVEGDRE